MWIMIWIMDLDQGLDLDHTESCFTNSSGKTSQDAPALRVMQDFFHADAMPKFAHCRRESEREIWLNEFNSLQNTPHLISDAQQSLLTVAVPVLLATCLRQIFEENDPRPQGLPSRTA